MDLLCYLQPGWEPRIRPASQKRGWMDETPDSFAYRCLPLNIANAHGWEVLSPCGFEARWTGGIGTDAVEFLLDEGTQPHKAPVSQFGHGTITFHIEGLFRTPPGWNLWVGGSPNQAKDGIAPLSGVVETDWSPYTFTMNWRLTRHDQWVRFEENEPICFFFPVQRGPIENMKPKLVPMADNPELKAKFDEWSASRVAFQERMEVAAPDATADTWQKLYYRGRDPNGRPAIKDHQSKLRVSGFQYADGAPLEVPDAKCPARNSAAPVPSQPSASSPADTLSLRRRDWILEVIERQRGLSPQAGSIHRREGLCGQAFLDHYYAPGRPVLLAGDMKGWPALERWTPDYLRHKVGSAEIEYQGDRTSNDAFELEKHRHKRIAPFDRFVDLVMADGVGNDVYLTATNSARNVAALAPLEEDLGFFEKLLSRETPLPNGMMWIGPAGTFTPMHHDITNNLLAQIRGRKRVVLAPPSEAAKMYNRLGVFSDIGDITDPALDRERFPRAAEARLVNLILHPGEALFIPIGWWHQVTSLDFSVSITYNNFLWPNDGHASFPES